MDLQKFAKQTPGITSNKALCQPESNFSFCKLCVLLDIGDLQCCNSSTDDPFLCINSLFNRQLNLWEKKLKSADLSSLCSVNTISTLADIQCCKNLQELYIRYININIRCINDISMCFFLSERIKSLTLGKFSGWEICQDWKTCKIICTSSTSLYSNSWRASLPFYLLSNIIFGASVVPASST